MTDVITLAFPECFRECVHCGSNPSRGQQHTHTCLHPDLTSTIHVRFWGRNLVVPTPYELHKQDISEVLEQTVKRYSGGERHVVPVAEETDDPEWWLRALMDYYNLEKGEGVNPIAAPVIEGWEPYEL